MRKLAVFSIFLVVLGFISNANAGTCGPNAITYIGNQSPTDNEFLYVNKTEFDKSEAGYLNTGKYGSGDGKAWECDDEFCPYGKTLEMNAGHVFNGQVINIKTKYTCAECGFGSDCWIPVSQDVCKYRNYTIPVGKALNKNMTIIDCSGLDITDTSGESFELICRSGPHLICKAKTCKNGLVADNAGKCVVAKTEAQNNCENANGTIWDKDKKECKCSDKSKIWNAAKKQCINKPIVIVNSPVKKSKVSECDELTINWLREVQLKYSDDEEIIKLVQEIIDYCTNDDNRSQMNFDNNITKLKILIDIRLKKSQAVINSENTIKSLTISIKEMQSGMGISVWKDKEGEFNKSRLVSDSVAGVVLGTAGGLITSSVIKKNQEENGFEDISCTVGGQVVAGWGDEFTVGVR
ncbi:MAG: hypothetical protein JW974_02475 [Alphaproteobacteria bacterium]|nr:hypothetical protein [Alphaproteobacteria bacterium]MBN2675162.1 hypothetical protein [Alphaproteobacteria bacterium]